MDSRLHRHVESTTPAEPTAPHLPSQPDASTGADAASAEADREEVAPVESPWAPPAGPDPTPWTQESSSWTDGLAVESAADIAEAEGSDSPVVHGPAWSLPPSEDSSPANGFDSTAQVGNGVSGDTAPHLEPAEPEDESWSSIRWIHDDAAVPAENADAPPASVASAPDASIQPWPAGDRTTEAAASAAPTEEFHSGGTMATPATPHVFDVTPAHADTGAADARPDTAGYAYVDEAQDASSTVEPPRHTSSGTGHDPTHVTPTGMTLSESAAEPGARDADAAASVDHPDGGAKVPLTLWVDSHLSLRARAAHFHAGSDEGYGSVSEYVAAVLARDVERLERTYNQGAAFPLDDVETAEQAATYRVRARHGDGLWELDIDGAGVTLSPTLAGAETMARTYLSLQRDVPFDAVRVEIVPELEPGLVEDIARSRHGLTLSSTVLDQAREALAQAQAAVARAEAAQADAEAHQARVNERLRNQGLSDADIETVLRLIPDVR